DWGLQNLGTNTVINYHAAVGMRGSSVTAVHTCALPVWVVNAQDGILQLVGEGTSAKGTFTGSSGGTVSFFSGTFTLADTSALSRSEERRVGKDCTSRATVQLNENNSLNGHSNLDCSRHL